MRGFGMEAKKLVPGLPDALILRPVRIYIAAAIAAAAAGVAAARLGTPTVRADTLPGALYVSGLHIDGDKPTALIDLSNRSDSSDDFYALSVLFFHADGHRAADQLDIASPLTSGKSITINVGGIVSAYRASHEIAPFKGPVQVVIYGYTCTDLGTCQSAAVARPFGPEVIHVAAVQTEGKVTYDGVVQWRLAQ
jgi:hypothetical protein